MELTGLKTNFATKLEAQASELRDSEERVMLLEKQVTFLSNSEVNTAVTAKDNRLVQKAGLANTEAADDDAAEEVPLPEAGPLLWGAASRTLYSVPYTELAPPVTTPPPDF